MAKRWTDEEKNFLKENYPSKGGSFCADKLNRTIKAVALQAMRQGISVTKPCSSRTKTTYPSEVKYEVLEPYVNNKTPILHQCDKGHKWKASPQSVLKGTGCPTCAKYAFNPNMPAQLYFISFNYEDKQYFKIGITNKNVADRLKYEPIDFNVIWTLDFSKGLEAKNIEQRLLKSNSNSLVNLGILSRGNTEVLQAYIDKPDL